MGLVEQFRSELSPEYLSFIDAAAESVSMSDFVLLYGREDIDERNETFEVQRYMPGYLAIGDDGGGRALLLKCDGTSTVSMCDHGATDEEFNEIVADSFAEWLAAGCPLPD